MTRRTRHEEAPLSPLDDEIDTLLGRLTALTTSPPTPEQAPIREVAIKALRDRLRELSRKCDDSTCRVRTIQNVKKALGED